jgi:hypothetical protein
MREEGTADPPPEIPFAPKAAIDFGFDSREALASRPRIAASDSAMIVSKKNSRRTMKTLLHQGTQRDRTR